MKFFVGKSARLWMRYINLRHHNRWKESHNLKTRQDSGETDNRWGPEDFEQTKVAFESRTLCKFIWKWQWYWVSVKTPFLFPFRILSTNSFSLDIFCFSPILSHKISHNELILQIWFKNFVMKEKWRMKMKMKWSPGDVKCLASLSLLFLNWGLHIALGDTLEYRTSTLAQKSYMCSLPWMEH